MHGIATSTTSKQRVARGVHDAVTWVPESRGHGPKSRISSKSRGNAIHQQNWAQGGQASSKRPRRLKKKNDIEMKYKAGYLASRLFCRKKKPIYHLRRARAEQDSKLMDKAAEMRIPSSPLPLYILNETISKMRRHQRLEERERERGREVSRSQGSTNSPKVPFRNPLLSTSF